MDPFIVIKHGDEVYRTKVIRHDLNPTYNDKFILFIRRSASNGSSLVPSTASIESSPISLSLLDWERVSKDSHIGDASLDTASLIDLAPKPDPETALYSEEAMRLHGYQDLTLTLVLDNKKKDRWDGQASPAIVVR